MLTKLNDWFFRFVKRNAGRGLRASMLVALAETRTAELEFIERELRASMSEWSAHWKETGEDQSLANAVRYRDAAQTIRDILEVTG